LLRGTGLSGEDVLVGQVHLFFNYWFRIVKISHHFTDHSSFGSACFIHLTSLGLSGGGSLFPKIGIGWGLLIFQTDQHNHSKRHDPDKCKKREYRGPLKDSNF
jgi:hypothetical protein